MTRILVFIFFTLYLALAQYCPLKPPHYHYRFGPSCEYLCHCGEYQCNKETGECPENIECDPGWMGLDCQHVNIAFKAPVQTIHLTNGQRITDSVKSSCAIPTSLSKNIAYLTVDFGTEMKITEVHLLFAEIGNCTDKRDHCTAEWCDGGQWSLKNCAKFCHQCDYRTLSVLLAKDTDKRDHCMAEWCVHQWSLEICAKFCHQCAHPFNVSIIGKNETNLCGSVNDTSGKKQFIVKCWRPVYGQRINISSVGRDGGLALCELQVPAGRNLAYGKPAYQSSIVGSYYASQAVDGYATYIWSEYMCSHTKDSTDPWWLLDLQALVMIQWLRIYNREDNRNNPTLNERLKNFQILLSEDNVTFNKYYQDTKDNPELVIVSVSKSDVTARFVKIDLQGDNRILTLCEVQVFGDCTDGRYGDCNKTCGRCLDNKCDKFTGYCEECQHGYHGNLCNISCDYCMDGDCKRETGICDSCPPGKHGNFCQENCPDHFYGSNCLKQCGSCLDGDTCGWKEQYCHTECEDYFYGNCSTRCGQCADGKPCNKSSGICDKGSCAPGWQSDKCDIPCDDNFYGNCTTRCGHCSDSALCDKVNGSCPSRLCSEGWSGEKCNTNTTEKIPQTVFEIGIIGGSVSGVITVVVLLVVIVIIIFQRRRNMDPNVTDVQTVERNAYYVNLAVHCTDTISKNNVIEEGPNTYYNIEESNLSRGVAIHEMGSGSQQQEADTIHNDYEQLRAANVMEDSKYSTLEYN